MLPGVSRRLLLVVSGVGALIFGIALALVVAAGGDDSGTPSASTESIFRTTSRSSDIAVLELATGRIRLVTRRKGPYLSVSSPTWSPNGGQLAFAQQTCSHCAFRIAMVEASGGPATPVTSLRSDVNEPSWSPGGDRLAATTTEHSERALALVNVPGGRLRQLEPHVEEGSEEEGEEEVEAPNHPAFSPDGRSIAFDAESARERTSVQLLDVVSGEVRAVENDADHYSSPTFSPSGRRLAFSRTDAAFTWDVCVAPLAGVDQVCITRGPSNDTEPNWSPDGRSIVFASDRVDPKVGLRSLYVVNTDGSGLRRLTTGFDDGAPAYSPDGARIAFVRRQILEVPR